MNFDLVFLVMNPGYNPINRQKIINNAKLLNIPVTMFEKNINGEKEMTYILFNVLVDLLNIVPCVIMVAEALKEKR